MPKTINRDEINKILFWSKVDGLAGDGCWEWRGLLDRDGYGVFCVNKRLGNRRAHRVAFVISNNKEAEICCHSCDNRKCVNPNHLFSGNQLDNMKDMRAKRRDSVSTGNHRVGEQSHHAKLTEHSVREIRSLCEDGVTHEEIAKRFNISLASVSFIRNRKRWKHVE